MCRFVFEVTTSWRLFSLSSALDPWQDLEDGGGKAGYKRLTDYKKTHRHLKVLLAIGGWNEGSQNYSELAGHPERRQRFVQQSSEFIRRHNFDGESDFWVFFLSALNFPFFRTRPGLGVPNAARWTASGQRNFRIARPRALEGIQEAQSALEFSVRSGEEDHRFRLLSGSPGALFGHDAHHVLRLLWRVGQADRIQRSSQRGLKEPTCQGAHRRVLDQIFPRPWRTSWEAHHGFALLRADIHHQAWGTGRRWGRRSGLPRPLHPRKWLHGLQWGATTTVWVDLLDDDERFSFSVPFSRFANHWATRRRNGNGIGTSTRRRLLRGWERQQKHALWLTTRQDPSPIKFAMPCRRVWAAWWCGALTRTTFRVRPRPSVAFRVVRLMRFVLSSRRLRRITQWRSIQGLQAQVVGQAQLSEVHIEDVSAPQDAERCHCLVVGWEDARGECGQGPRKRSRQQRSRKAATKWTCFGHACGTTQHPHCPGTRRTRSRPALSVSFKQWKHLRTHFTFKYIFCSSFFL